MDYSVAAVVVTYNRKILLQECLDAILNQSYPVSKIILIDNASTDGTGAFLKENGYLDKSGIDYRLMDKNLGGSGGFYEGLRIAREDMGCDWVWIMDDDTIPTENCLEKLLIAYDKIAAKNSSDQIDGHTISFLASSIYGADGEFMNVPVISNRPSKNGYAYWYNYLADGLVNIESATFVSILVKKDAINKCGLPCRDYFIWGDDSEYTTRLTRFYGDAYLVGDSIAIHKRKNAKALDIKNEDDPKRMQMYSFHSRNNAINRMYYDGKSKMYIFIKAVYGFFKDKKRVGRVKARITLKGNLQAMKEYKKFKEYIDGQIES